MNEQPTTGMEVRVRPYHHREGQTGTVVRVDPSFYPRPPWAEPDGVPVVFADHSEPLWYLPHELERDR